MKRSRLYHYQREGLLRVLALDGCAGIFSEMGTGKTRVAIEAACLLKRKVLVVAPLSAVGVWQREVEKWAPGARVVDCTRGTVRVRANRMNRTWMKRPSTQRLFVLVGYESFWREPLKSEIVAYAPDMIIYDEAHRLKSRRTRMSKFAHALAADNHTPTPEYRLALTGTPMPNGPEDIWSIMKAIRPEVFGSRWADFEQRYIKKGGYMHYQVVGYNHLPELQAKVAWHSIRTTKAEALDLPEQVDVEVPVILSMRERRTYDALKKNAVAEVEGLRGETGIALSRIVMVNTLRLQQIAAGFVKTEDDGIIDVGESKRKTLHDLLQDVVPESERVVIFCRFRHDLRVVGEIAEGVVGEDAVYRIDGHVTPARRELAIRNFGVEAPAILVAQVQVASLAIDLTAASVAIFYTPDFSLTNYLQSRDRLHRIGQNKKVTYYHLVGKDTVDEKIYAALDRKEDLMRKLLDRKSVREFFGG